MGKLLEVREFDSITCNHEFKLDDNFKYHAGELKQFNSIISNS